MKVKETQLFIKKTDNNKKYNMEESIPYPNAKPMYLVEDVDNIDLLKNIVLDTYNDLK